MAVSPDRLWTSGTAWFPERPAGVDVIVPCYNYGLYLRTCCASVLSETRIPVRVLIIDDASSDGSALEAERIAAEDSRVEVVRHAVNLGHIATYNEGLKWVRAPYMLLLSADDVVAPGALWRAIELMNSEPSVGWVFGRAASFTNDDELTQNAPESSWTSTIKAGATFIEERCLDLANPVETATAVVRTSVQTSVGDYRPQLPHAGDLEMWLRCAARSDVGVIETLQAFVRVHPHNMRKQYGGADFLADYLQRRDAFRSFFQVERRQLDEAARLESEVFSRLSDELFDEASRAFDRGRPYEKLLNAALETWPPLQRTWAFVRLQLKRRGRALIGERLWWAWQARNVRTATSWRPEGGPDVASPLVSLIISTRDRAAVLPACLQALTELMSEHPWELVFVDNGSTDETWSALARFAAAASVPVRLVRQPRPGLSHARNAGIRVASAPIICFTDDDCYPRPDFIDAVVRAFAETSVGFMGGRVLLFDPADAPICITERNERAIFAPGAFLTTGEIHGACMAFRREVFEQLGGFDPAFGAGAPLKAAEDCDLVTRACLQGWEGGFFTEPVVYHHHRRRERDAERLTSGYDFSRGAFFAKLLLCSPGRRRLILKNWFWDTPVLWRPSRRNIVKAWRELQGAARYALFFSYVASPRLV